MSIISDAATGKTTWATAGGLIAQYIAKAFGQTSADPVVAQQAGQLMTDLKQAASDAIGLADTALGPIIGAGALAVEAAMDAALTRAIGPLATQITPSIDTTITQAANALKAAIDARALAMRAKLTPAAAPAVVSSTVQSAPSSSGNG